jgi:hypothetical protein
MLVGGGEGVVVSIVGGAVGLVYVKREVWIFKGVKGRRGGSFGACVGEGWVTWAYVGVWELGGVEDSWVVGVESSAGEGALVPGAKATEGVFGVLYGFGVGIVGIILLFVTLAGLKKLVTFFWVGRVCLYRCPKYCTTANQKVFSFVGDKIGLDLDSGKSMWGWV